MKIIDNVDEKNFLITAKGSKKDILKLVYLIEDNICKGEKKKDVDSAIDAIEQSETEDTIIDFSSIARLKLAKGGFSLYSAVSNPQFYFSTIKKAYLDSKKVFDEKKK